MIGKRFIIFGRVQGVGYRYSVLRFVQQQKLSIKGYVKNTPAGTVEVVAYGKEGDVDRLLEYCSQGPIYSKVEKVQTENIDMDKISFMSNEFIIQY